MGRGDITMMLSVWLLRHREAIGIDVKIKKKKSKKNKGKKKKRRKLNSLMSTDDLHLDEQNNEQLQIENVKGKEKKRKKKKVKKKKRKKSLLKTHPNITVVDDSQIIQNVLEQEKRHNIEDEIATLNIEDIIDEHLENENGQKKQVETITNSNFETAENTMPWIGRYRSLSL